VSTVKPKASSNSTARTQRARSGPSVRRGQHAGSTYSYQPLGANYSGGPAFGISASAQAKFTVGKAGDPFEQEADIAADHVMSGKTVPSITPVPSAGLGSIAKATDENADMAQSDDELEQTKSIQREEGSLENTEKSQDIDEESVPLQAELEEAEFGESGAQPRLIQRDLTEEEEESGEAQAKLIQRQTENEQEENEMASVQAQQKEQQEDIESEPQAKLLQKKCDECESKAGVETDPPQTRLVQRNEETDQNEAVEEEVPVQSKFLQRKDDDKETTEQPKLIQRDAKFPTIPNAEKPDSELKQNTEGESSSSSEDGLVEKTADTAGDQDGGSEGGGVDPTYEPYEPVEKEPPVQMKRSDHRESSSLERGLSGTGSSGRPMEDNVRTDMESHFQRDLSDVRIHTDGGAAQMNKDLGARAFTQGRDIYFSAGQYAPTTDSGKHLLSHELTHTVQQGAIGGVVQRWEAPEQSAASGTPAQRPNDGAEVTGRMNRKITEETEDRDPEDMDEEERREARNPDRGEVRRDTSTLNSSGQSSPSVDRGAAAQQETAAQSAQIQQQISEPTPEGNEEAVEGSEESSPPSDADAAGQRAEEAEANAQSVVIPDRPQPFRHPRMETPVDSAGEALPIQGAMDMRVSGLGYIGEMLREKGYEMKRAAAESTIGSFGQDAVLERLREDLANSIEGTELMKSHSEERKTIIEQSREAHQESVERQSFVAAKAPDLASSADSGQADSGALASEASSKAARAEGEIPNDPDARADGERQSADMQDSSQGAESMDQAVRQTGQRARQYQQDASQASEQNQQSQTRIDETESTVTETDARLDEMASSNDASNEQIENAGPGPALIRENSQRTARSGDQLIAATIVMELELNALQEEYLASAAALESKEEAQERIREEQERQAEQPDQTAEQQQLTELGNASEEEQQSIIEDMDQEQRDALIREIENQPTQEEANSELSRTGLTVFGGPDPDPRAPQIAEIDNQRSSRVDGVLNIADQNMNHLTAAQQEMLANRIVAESISDSISNISVLQMLPQMLEGMVNPFVSIDGVIDGFNKIGGGLTAAFSGEAWAADPLGNLLKVAADVSTGLAMVFSSVLGLAALITGLMVILTIVSWGTLSPMTGPVIGWMGTVMTYAGWGAIIAGGLSVYFNYLSYIKNLSDAATAPTARELFTNADEMKQNATDGFTGAMAVVEGVGAVKMGPGLSNGTHFARVPRSPRAALNRAGAGVRRAGAGIAAAPGRLGRGIASTFRGGLDGLMRLKDRLRSFARRGERPPMRADIPGDVPIRTPRDGNLGSFDGQRVRAEVDLPGNQRMRVLEDGRCVVCSSPCRHLSQNFGSELASNPRLAQRLERIERSLARNPNQPRVIQAHRDIQLQLRQARVDGPSRIRANYADELADNPALARQLDGLEPRIASSPTSRRHQRRIESIERKLQQQQSRVNRAIGGRSQARARGYPNDPPPGYEWYSGQDGRPKVRRARGNSTGPRREFDPEVPATRRDGSPTPLEERFPERPARRSRLRDQYLGGTPGKRSATGRRVIDRMRGETPPVGGRIQGVEPNEIVWTRGPDGQERWYDIELMDMGHNPDAVRYWNAEGRRLGPRHPDVRRWMLDSDHYELQHRSVNRSEGAILGNTPEGRYQPPLSD